MSYAKNRNRGSNPVHFNHFVVHNHLDVIGCHDFEARLQCAAMKRSTKVL